MCVTVKNAGPGNAGAVLTAFSPTSETFSVPAGRTTSACGNSVTRIDLMCDSGSCRLAWRMDHAPAGEIVSIEPFEDHLNSANPGLA